MAHCMPPPPSHRMNTSSTPFAYHSSLQKKSPRTRRRLYINPNELCTFSHFDT
ncbi:hypothetical protein BC939DRAFT_434654 [Gamsiella multidivaricata]|uniref:uncharacterized protein n=1 Tax=Gamsiella multidivaricata TaxID=101098 RepID=UPI00221F58C2|nr:uncharacterized protein BC939DRAFT_434654 [Gamsiella multidivaricata]KAI7832862.1 hypothetical protein BC939DRAFT_434654 [Gamsiella multidivaricata]